MFKLVHFGTPITHWQAGGCTSTESACFATFPKTASPDLIFDSILLLIWGLTSVFQEDGGANRYKCLFPSHKDNGRTANVTIESTM